MYISLSLEFKKEFIRLYRKCKLPKTVGMSPKFGLWFVGLAYYQGKDIDYI
jgi:hypothetical protein